MKKFFGVLVAIVLCVCMLVPAASALDEGLLSEYFAGADLSTLSEADLTAILSDLGIANLDVAAIISGDESSLAELEASLNDLTGETTTAAAASSDEVASGVDMSWLTGLLGGSMDTSAVTDMLGGLGAGDLDSLLGTVEGAFSGAGVDLGDYELGENVAGDSTSESAPATDAVAGIADSIFAGLEALGLDTSLIEGMLDNDIVNFFANMYIGFSGEVEETTEEPTVITTTEAPTTVPTTKTPDTGDTSAVFAAIATLTVASAAAFVCLKKKEN
ncbi:MAG: hypothetical protein J6Q79_01335 [Clostridia bacterium]|nr:hypothetical protein [Clostridia bacterium]